jgi:hypothetical protein
MNLWKLVISKAFQIGGGATQEKLVYGSSGGKGQP